jgi:hypothetical protein
MPVVTTYKPHTSATKVPTIKNRTPTGKLNQKPPKPPEITQNKYFHYLSALPHCQRDLFPLSGTQKIVAKDSLTSGRDPPHVAKSFYRLHTTYKIQTHFQLIPGFALFFFLFSGNEGIATLEGAHGVSEYRASALSSIHIQPSHVIWCVTHQVIFVDSHACL